LIFSENRHPEFISGSNKLEAERIPTLRDSLTKTGIFKQSLSIFKRG